MGAKVVMDFDDRDRVTLQADLAPLRAVLADVTAVFRVRPDLRASFEVELDRLDGPALASLAFRGIVVVVNPSDRLLSLRDDLMRAAAVVI